MRQPHHVSWAAAARVLGVAITASVVVVACGGGGEPNGVTTTVTTVSKTPLPQTTVSTAPPTRPPSTTTTSFAPADPLEVATAWVVSFEAGDVAAFQALMHPEAVGHCQNFGYQRAETPYFIGEGTRDLADSRLLTLGNGSLNAQCTVDGPVVICQTLWTSDFGFTTEDGEPTRQWDLTFELTVEDGLVTRRGLINNGGTSFDREKVAQYERWLKENHADVHVDTFAFGTILLTTDQQYELHQEYVPQFWASQ